MEGVLHEFSPIPGAKEDTTDLILNLKPSPSSCTWITRRR